MFKSALLTPGSRREAQAWMLRIDIPLPMRPHPHRVLVADDQPLIRWAIGRTLQTLGFESVFAASRQDALARAAECTFALAFVANPFEGRDAACVVQALKAGGTLRVIVLSESDVAFDPSDSSSLVVVQKPFSLDAVVNAVDALTRGSG